MRSRLILLAVGAALLATACGRGGAAPLPTKSDRGFPLGDLTVQHGGSTQLSLTVEIADNEPAREKGLMGVKSLSDTQGMAFIWTQSQAARFWMKDTLIPLDIAFWDTSGKIVGVDTMTPCTADPCQIYSSPQPYVGAVEVRGGLLGKVRVHPGDTVHFSRRAQPSPSS